MTQWDEQFDQHGVQEALAQLRAAIEAAGKTLEDHKISEPAARDGLARLEAVSAWIGNALAGADKLVTPQGVLNNLQSGLRNSLNELNQFNSNRSVGHITNACNQLDSAMVHSRQLPIPSSAKDVDAFSQAASQFRILLARESADIRGDLGELEKAKAALQTELQEMRKEVQQQKARLDAALTEHQTAFSRAETSRLESATGLLAKIEADSKAAEERRSSRHEAAMQAILKKEEEVLARIAQLKEKAEKLVQATGSAGMTTGYQRVANRMAWHAVAWQFGAIASVAAFVVFGAIYVLPHVSGQSAWTLVLVRVFMSLPLLLLAGFCVGQVGHFHRLEEQNRSMELQLASLDPFVATLPDPQQLAIKAQAVTRFFPGQNGQNASAPEVKP